MDCRAAILFCFIVVLAYAVASGEGRRKKVIIHVPFKVKKIKHTHTIYKTIHHHHSHHDGAQMNHLHHLPSATEEHEHFHHMHVHDDSPNGQHSSPLHDMAMPDYLPLDVPIELPDVPLEVAPLNRHQYKSYRPMKI